MVSGPSGGGSDHSEIPGAEGSDFFAPSATPQQGRDFSPKKQTDITKDRRKSVEEYFGEDRRSKQTRPYQATKTSPAEDDSDYKLRSKAETLYPEAFIPVSKEFYDELSKEQQDQLIKLQAIAQEKAGFEKNTPKFFIRDFDPGGGTEGSYTSTPADPVTDAAPRLVVGGALIGAGLLATLLAVTGLLSGGAVLIAGLLGLGIGVSMLFIGRS